ncbi:hypothetical protein D3C72_428690 [compost metagenome]
MTAAATTAAPMRQKVAHPPPVFGEPGARLLSFFPAPAGLPGAAGSLEPSPIIQTLTKPREDIVKMSEGGVESRKINFGLLERRLSQIRDHCRGPQSRNQQNPPLQLEPVGQKAAIHICQKLYCAVQVFLCQSGSPPSPLLRRSIILTRLQSYTQNHHSGLQDAERRKLICSSAFRSLMPAMVKLLREQVHCDTSRPNNRRDRTQSLNPACRFVVGRHPCPNRLKRRSECVDPNNCDNRRTNCPPQNHKATLLHISVTAQLTFGVQL